MSAEEPLQGHDVRVTLESTPLCTGDTGASDQARLLAAVRAGHLQQVTHLVSCHDVDINHFYDNPDYCTCLQAAIEGGQHDIVAELLRRRANYEANLNVWNPVRQTTLLHLAVEKKDYRSAGLLLDHGADVGAKNGEGRTPLHVLATLPAADDAEGERCVAVGKALLTGPNIDVGAADLAGCSALYLAAAVHADHVARLLLSNGADPGCTVDGRSVGELLQERGVSLEPDPALDVNAPTGCSAQNVLFETLQQRNLTRFGAVLRDKSPNQRELDAFHDNTTCLQYASDNGLDDFVVLLLRHGANVNLASPTNGRTALHYAAARGYHRVLEKLVHHEPPPWDVPDIDGETVLHKLARAEYEPGETDIADGEADRGRCLQLLTELQAKVPGRLYLDVNGRDELGSTPLHYAVARGDAAAIEALLRLGANIGVKNRFGETPLQGLPADALQKYLDEFVTCNERPVSDAQFQIDLCYSFLTPRRCGFVYPLPETESLWYMAQSKRHQHLLKHPVISSFLDLKWQMVWGWVWANLALYSLFVILMTTFVFLNIEQEWGSRQRRQAPDSSDSVDGHKTSSKNTSDAGFQFVFFATALILVLLMLRELFQLFVASRRYIFSFENYLETSMLVLSALLLFSDVDEEQTRRYSALVILLSWTEFFMLMGRLPLFSIYVTMFTTVLFRFVRFLAWYLVLIVAFSLSMFVLFQGDKAFPNPSSALIKTMVMTIGEMDYGSLPITQHTPVAQLVFVAFLFLITVVLMNLLNGLAVADTGEIQDQAQIYGYVGRVELISYIESMLLGDLFHFLSNYPPFKWLRWVPDSAPCSCLGRSPLTQLRTWLGGRTLLFFNALPNKNLTVLPNQRNWQLDPNPCHARFSLDKQIIEDAKTLLIRKRQPADDVSERLEQLEKKLDMLLSHLLPAREMTD